MSSVADQLRCAREASNLDIHQVAESTNIKTEHILALEEGNYDAFPAPVYIRGFTRTYATLLKLDVPAVMAALDAELTQSGRLDHPANASTDNRSVLDFIMLQLSKLNWVVAGLVLLVIIIGVSAYYGITAWHRRKTTDPLSGLSPGIYQPAQTNTGEYLAIPTNPPPRK